MRLKNSIVLAAVMSLGMASSVFAQSAHPDQPLGAEDRLGGAPEGQSGKAVGRSSAGNAGSEAYQPGTAGESGTAGRMMPAPAPAPGAPSQK